MRRASAGPSVARIRRELFKRKQQTPDNTRWLVVLILFHANDHVVVTIARLVDIGAENPVPYGQIEAVIAVG